MSLVERKPITPQAGYKPNDSEQLQHVDDHISLSQAGIPSLLLLDFDYPYFNTTQDTYDKCSVDSLKYCRKCFHTVSL